MSAEPVKNFFASVSGLSFCGLILTSVCPFTRFALLKRVGTSSMKSVTQNVVLTIFDWVVSSQLKLLLFSSLGIFRNANEPSSSFCSMFLNSFYSRPSTAFLTGGAGDVPCYAFFGIKQRREPTFAFEFEGVLFERAKAKPAAAPSFAPPPNRTPRSVTDSRMFV